MQSGVPEGTALPPIIENMAKEDTGMGLDRLISVADQALRAVFAPAHASRPLPVTGEKPPLSEPERRESGSLMRVNHTGEVAAQALYHGQAFVARSEGTRQMLVNAAREEADHLAWCE